MAALSLDNFAVQAFIIHSAILALKMFAMSALTAGNRIARGVFPNPEDAKFLRGEVKFGHPVVERIRRAHLNDLENIPAYWLLGALYLTTEPSVWLATQLFRTVTVCRVIHSIVYAVIPLPQPSRAIAFGIPYVISLYMAVQVIVYYITSI